MDNRGPIAFPPPSHTRLDRASPLPLYAQIKRRLLALVLAWPDPERRFHTDEDLCRMFGVSRMTVRQAVQELVAEGYLVRTRGLGTHVAGPKVDERFTPAMDFLDQWADRGRPIHIRLLRFGPGPCPAQDAAALGVAAGSEVLLIERLRLGGKVPVSIDLRSIPARLAGAFDREAAAQRSLLDVLRGVTGVARATMTIEAAGALPEDAELLQVVPGDPVLLRRFAYTDEAGTPVMAGRSTYRADQVRYVVEIPVSSARGQALARAHVLDGGDRKGAA